MDGPDALKDTDEFKKNDRRRVIFALQFICLFLCVLSALCGPVFSSNEKRKPPRTQRFFPEVFLCLLSVLCGSNSFLNSQARATSFLESFSFRLSPCPSAISA